ncbi:MAG: hypothetical protein MK207_12290 [Saprospiraceae bacterium]|nr:hypothetical protein [Saprospiraceae bacterium]
MKIEICLDTPLMALEAQKNGANRIELCSNISEGGTTPSAGCIAKTRELIHIDLFVMIRPRAGDFFYNEKEIEEMIYNIEISKSLGANGVVFGLLEKDGNVDIKNTKMLTEIASPMKVTFHRAFDRCKLPFKSMESLIDIGVDRILTSGQCAKAVEGIALISDLIKQANNRIIIMPGSGVNEKNIKLIATKTNAIEFHFTAHKFIKPNPIYQHTNFNVSEYRQKVFDHKKLKYCIEALEKYNS